jgi:hypothetical protein
MFRRNIARTAFMSSRVITAILAFRSSPLMSALTGTAITATAIFIVTATVGTVSGHRVMIGAGHLPAGIDLRHHVPVIGTDHRHVLVTGTGIVRHHVQAMEAGTVHHHARVTTGTARHHHAVRTMVVGNSVMARNGIVVSGRRAATTIAVMIVGTQNAETTIVGTMPGVKIIVRSAGTMTAVPVATMVINRAASMSPTVHVAAPMIGANHACLACPGADPAFDG